MTQFLNGVLEGSMKKLRKATEFSTKNAETLFIQTLRGPQKPSLADH